MWASRQCPCLAPCATWIPLPSQHLVGVGDEEHAGVRGRDLKGVGPVDGVLRALDGEALADLNDASGHRILRGKRDIEALD